MNVVHVAVHGRAKRHRLLVAACEGDLTACHGLVGDNPIVQVNVHADDRHAVDQFSVHHSTVTVGVPTVAVRVFIAVGSVPWVEPVAGLPTVWHLVKVGVNPPW